MIRELVRTLADVKRKGMLFTIKWICWGYQLKLSALKNRKFVVSKYQIKLVPNYSDATFRLYVFGAYGYFYSDFIGATVGTSIAAILKNYLGYDDDNPISTPIWVEALSIPTGCIAGMYTGKFFFSK